MRSDDPFLLQYDDSELRIASEFLASWLPFLSRDLCRRCSRLLSDRVLSLSPESDVSEENSKSGEDDEHDNNCDSHSLGSWKDESHTNWSYSTPIKDVAEFSSEKLPGLLPSESTENEESDDSSQMSEQQDVAPRRQTTELSRDQREYLRLKSVKRKKDFVCLERMNGKMVNIVEGLELHTGVFSAVEQKRIVGFISDLQEKGKRRELKERTYTAPRKWMRGKGRETIQFGCCYNYATDKSGNPPGILRDDVVDPIPSLFKVIIRRLVRWRVLPPSCVPDSCIVNIYEEGDCIPPHIDNHDFLRPFCTISFLSECDIVFGTDLKVVGPGEFSGSFAIPLPVGSVLVLKGNGADVAKHCVPAVPTKRISITFRRMDEAKRPMGYEPEPDLQGLEPLNYDDRILNGSAQRQPSNGLRARRGSEHVRSEEPYSLKIRRGLSRDRTGHRVR